MLITHRLDKRHALCAHGWAAHSHSRCNRRCLDLSQMLLAGNGHQCIGGTQPSWPVAHDYNLCPFPVFGQGITCSWVVLVPTNPAIDSGSSQQSPSQLNRESVGGRSWTVSQAKSRQTIIQAATGDTACRGRRILLQPVHGAVGMPWEAGDGSPMPTNRIQPIQSIGNCHFRLWQLAFQRWWPGTDRLPTFG